MTEFDIPDPTEVPVELCYWGDSEGIAKKWAKKYAISILDAYKEYVEVSQKEDKEKIEC